MAYVSSLAGAGLRYLSGKLVATVLQSVTWNSATSTQTFTLSDGTVITCVLSGLTGATTPYVLDFSTPTPTTTAGGAFAAAL